MPCPRTVLLSAYLDHVGTDRRQAPIRAHIQSCPVCAAELWALRQLCGELQALPASVPDMDMASQFRPPPASTLRRLLRRTGPGWSPSGLAIAASLALGVGLGALLVPASSSSDTHSWAASLHVFDPVPPGGLCAAAGLCTASKEQT